VVGAAGDGVDGTGGVGHAPGGSLQWLPAGMLCCEGCSWLSRLCESEGERVLEAEEATMKAASQDTDVA